jgi:hypothetical protein
MKTNSKLVFIEFFKKPNKGQWRGMPFLRRLSNLVGILLDLLGVKHA